MLRHVATIYKTTAPAHLSPATRTFKRSYAHGKNTNTDEDELAAARKWLAKLDAEPIPRSIADISFSRSSGPGGQNVNKLSPQTMKPILHFHRSWLRRYVRIAG